MIDYEEEQKKTFETSGFFAKNAHLLLMFYLFEEDKTEYIDYLFKIIRLWDISKIKKEDFKIIKDDWEKIIQKIILQ